MQAHANPRAVFHRPGSQRRLACRRVVHAEWNLKVVLALIAQQNRRWRAGAWKGGIRSERFPIEWNHFIEKESLKFNELSRPLSKKPVSVAPRTGRG